MPARDVNLAAAGDLTRHRSTAFSARALVGTGLKIILTEIGAVDHPRRERHRNRPHRDRGVPTHSVGRAPKSPH
jgi:hypothetical protein